MTLILRGPQESAGGGASAPMQCARIGGLRLGGGLTGPALVQAMIPIAPGSPLAFNINGVDCDVFPFTRDHVTGETDVVRIVAPVSNPTGRFSTIGRSTGAELLTVTQAAGTPAAATLRPCNLAGLQLHIKVAGVAERFVARPFDATHASVLATRTRRSGRYLEQTETLVRLVRQGVTTPSARTDTILVAYVYRTTRCDHRAEQIDVAVMNARWSPSDNAYQVSQAGDGEIYFEFVKLLGYEAQDSVEFMAPRLHQNAGPTESNLVNTAPGWPTAAHQFAPGSWFARRFVIYRTAEVTVQVARDIARRRDWAWSEGDLGYCNGNWGGFSHAPRFAELPGVLGGSPPYEDLIDIGNAFEARKLSDLVTAGPFDSRPDGGWSKPVGGALPYESGESHLDLMGLDAPTNGYWTGLLIEVDQFAERQHLAMINMDELRVARVRDLALPDGRLPYGFGVQYVMNAYLVLHFNWPGATNPPGGTLAPTSLPWNSLPNGWTAPFRPVTNWLHDGSTKWGPIAHTHHGRELTSFRAAFYAMDDPIAELAIRFRARAVNAAYHHWDIARNGPIDRFGYSREEGCLWNIWNNIVQGFPRGIGGWPAYKSTTTRSFQHSIASVATLHHLAGDDDRFELRGEGDPEHDFFLLVGRIVDRVTTGPGLLTHTDGISDGLFNGEPPDFALRRGAIPNRDAPLQSAAGITQKWTATQTFHQMYGAQWWHVVQRILEATNAAHAALLDPMIDYLDILEDATEVWRPDQRVVFSKIGVGAIGNNGVNNEPMSPAAARAGNAFWINSFSQPGESDQENAKPWACFFGVASYRLRHGQWDGVLRLAKRQFGAPSQMSDSALLRDLWTLVRQTHYQTGSPAEFTLQTLAFIGLLQSLGVVHPNAPNA